MTPSSPRAPLIDSRRPTSSRRLPRRMTRDPRFTTDPFSITTTRPSGRSAGFRRKPRSDVQSVAQAIVDKRREIPNSESLLVAISGIDGSGKGYVTSQLVRQLQGRGVNAVDINVD